MKSPFIIIGMHRSGTSLLAKILEKSGIFMGVIKDHNYEAIHFLSLNQQSMYAAGGDWLQPRVPESDYWKLLPADVLYREHFRINSRWQNWRLKLQNPDWGWKDPRNTYTLPMWLSLFPQARVIHLLRDEQAVALSLQKRNSVKGEVFDSRLNDLAFNLALHRQYSEQGRRYQAELGDRYMEVQYADLIAARPQTVEALDQFTGRKTADAIQKYAR